MAKFSNIAKAKPSGGPQTDEGKRISSRNSLKTGTYSKLIVLPNESQEEFDRLVDQFNLDFYPRDAFEISLVRELAVITWKKLRLEKLEQAYLIKKLNDQITLEEFLSCGVGFTKEAYEFWIGTKSMAEESLDKYEVALKFIKPHLRKNVTVDQLKHIQFHLPWIYESILDAYRQSRPMAERDPDLKDIVNRNFSLPDQPVKYLIPQCFEVLIPYCKSAIWCIKHREQIEQAIGFVKQERLLTLMQMGGVQRASDDLNRAMIRTMAEYRKHHEWRLNNLMMNDQDGLTK